MPKLHPWKAGFTYSAFVPFTKLVKKKKKFKKTGN